MTEEGKNNINKDVIDRIDIIYGSAYVQDNSDDPEIKEVGVRYAESMRNLDNWKRREDKKDYLMYLLSILLTYFIGIILILLIGLFFS